MQQVEDHVGVKGSAEQHEAGKGSEEHVCRCWTSLTLPGAQLVLAQPLAEDGRHLDNVGDVVHEDRLVFGDGEWVEKRLQTTQPVDGGGSALEDGGLIQTHIDFSWTLFVFYLLFIILGTFPPTLSYPRS